MPDQEFQHSQVLENFLQLCQKGEVRLLFPKQEGLCLSHQGMHFHDHYELFFQVEGSTLFTFPKSKQKVEAGEVIILPIGLPHRERGQHGVLQPFQYLCVAESQQIYTIHFGVLNEQLTPCGILVKKYKHQHDQSLRNILDQCFLLMRYGQADLIINQLLASTIACLLSSQSVNVPNKQKKLGGPLVQRCRELVVLRNNLPDCTVQLLARELDCSPNYLSAVFKKEAGISLSQYICNQRMKSACEMLETGRFNVRQISGACGYDDVSYFVKKFKDTYGITPKKYSLKIHEFNSRDGFN